MRTGARVTCGPEKGFALEAKPLRCVMSVRPAIPLSAAITATATLGAARALTHTFRAPTCVPVSSSIVARAESPTAAALAGLAAICASAGAFLPVPRAVHATLATVALATIGFATPI